MKAPRFAVEAAEWAESPALVEAAGGCLIPPAVEAVAGEQRVEVEPVVAPHQPFWRLQVQTSPHQRRGKANLTIHPLCHVVLISPAVLVIDDVGQKSWAWCWP